MCNELTQAMALIGAVSLSLLVIVGGIKFWMFLDSLAEGVQSLKSSRSDIRESAAELLNRVRKLEDQLCTLAGTRTTVTDVERLIDQVLIARSDGKGKIK